MRFGLMAYENGPRKTPTRPVTTVDAVVKTLPGCDPLRQGPYGREVIRPGPIVKEETGSGQVTS